MVKVGQFWTTTNDSPWVIEIHKINYSLRHSISVKARFWFPTGEGRYYLVGPARELTVHSFDFCNWKLIDIEK